MRQHSYNLLGVEEYEILGTLDSITCDECGGYDGKHFKREDMQVGVNAPPFHPNCRCTTIPYFDDEFTEGEERAARNLETGKTEYVESMTYEEWKEKFVNNDKFTSSIEGDIIKSKEKVASGQSRANRIKTKAIVQRGISEERPIFADDTFGEYIAKAKPETGFYDVALHGSPIVTEFFGTKIDSHTLAEIIRKRKDYTGGAVRLLSCNTGNEKNGVDCFAQRLANELKTDVKAPNNIIWAHSDGSISIGSTPSDKTGEFIIFHPTQKE